MHLCPHETSLDFHIVLSYQLSAISRQRATEFFRN